MRVTNSRIAFTFDDFTIRVIDSEFGKVERDVIQSVIDMATEVFAKRNLPPHLFITIVAGESLGGEGFGLYHSGMQHVAIAGLYPEGIDGLDRHQWLDELRVSVAHELIHYEQELNGTLESSEANELLTERLAYELAGVEMP